MSAYKPTDQDRFEQTLRGTLSAEADVRVPDGLQEIVAQAVRDTPAGSRRWLPTFPERRLRSTFSAVKFLAAAAIVALFGGFLVAGVLTTQQGDEAAPAAMTDSPSPMTTEELLSGMVTEEVEPGVHIVLNDGYRDLSPTRPSGPAHVVTGPDGSVWLDGSRVGILRLGRPGGSGDLDLYTVEVAPDGTLWGAHDDSVQTFDGESWTTRSMAVEVEGIRDIAIGPDGTVWIAARDRSLMCADAEMADCRDTVLVRFDEDGSSTTDRGWTDVYSGQVAEDDVAVSPDGDVWLMGVLQEGRVAEERTYEGGVEVFTPGLGEYGDAFLRFDGSEWEVVPGPEGLRNVFYGQSYDIGADGTVWAATRGDDWTDSHLARLDESGWTIFTEADGVRWASPSLYMVTDMLHVAPDGSVWVDAEGGGVAHFDGTTWSAYLQEMSLNGFDVASDGTVWVHAGQPDIGLHSLYVIRPEAAAAPE